VAGRPRVLRAGGARSRRSRHIAGLDAHRNPVPEEFGAPQMLTITVAA